MKVDEPTPNKGLIFPKIMLEGAIETYLVRENFIGMLEDESDVDKYDVNPSKVSHWVDNLYIDSEGYLCASIRFLDTPQVKWPRIWQMSFCSPQSFLLPPIGMTRR
jgi:hypothetical protein